MANDTQKPDHLFKILIVGDAATGKSCLLRRFVNDDFSGKHISTIGVDFMIKDVTIAGKSIKLQIWDTAGQERFQTITNSYYRGSNGVILMFDVTSRTTFKSIENRWKDISGCCSDNVVVILVGNKTDLTEKRVVTQEEAEDFAEKHGIDYVDASSKDNVNVSDTFLQLTKNLLQANGTSTTWWKKPSATCLHVHVI